MKKTILFDLDGTLTDSGEGIINCAQAALEKFGISVQPRERLEAFVGPPLGDSFAKFGIPAEQIEKAIEIFRSRYIPIGMFENKPYPGIQEMLSSLKSQGHQLCVATSKLEPTAVKVLAHFGLTAYFDCICGSNDQTRITKEEVIAFLLKNSCICEEVIMVGDTIFDVQGASKLNIPTIGVSWGYGNVEEMKQAGAIAIADSPEMLLEIINSEMITY